VVAVRVIFGDKINGRGCHFVQRIFWGEYITQICHILREKEEVEIVIFRP
jgi:hypothetical protein